MTAPSNTTHTSQNNNGNKENMGNIANLALEMPTEIFYSLASKVLNFSNSYFKNMINIVYDVDTNSKNWDLEVDKAKKMAKILFFVTTEVLKQPDVQVLYHELLEELKIFIEKGNVILQETLEQTHQIIAEQGDEAKKAAYQITRQASQSAIAGFLDSANAIPPPIGPLISAFRASGDIISPLQTVTQESLTLTLGILEKVLRVMKKMDTQGTEAVEASINAMQAAIAVTDSIKGKIDIIRDMLGSGDDSVQNQNGGSNYSRGTMHGSMHGTMRGGNNNFPPNYVSAADVDLPRPFNAERKFQAAKKALEPRAGLELPPKIQKALNDMNKLAEKVLKAQQAMEDVRNLGAAVEAAPRKLQQQAKKAFTDTKEELSTAIKPPQTAPAAAGGSRSRRCKKHTHRRTRKLNKS